MTAIIDRDIQLNPGGKIRLVQIDGRAFGADVYRFHYSPNFHTEAEVAAAGGDASKLGPKAVMFGGLGYSFWPFSVTDVALSTDQDAEPKLNLMNLDSFISVLCLNFDDMLDAEVTIIDTYTAYLDGRPEADPTQCHKQTFYIGRKESDDSEIVSFTLTNPADVDGMQAPARQILTICTWQLNGWYRSGNGCRYNGTAYFDEKGNPVSNPSQDKCGGCLSDCQKRFGAGLSDPRAAVLDFGGFPAASMLAGQ